MALQIAVLSTSRIVAEVMREIGNWPEVEVTAIICRPQSAEKAHAWAAEYGVPAVYTDEAAAYAAGGFDAVYIGTANHLHYAAAKRALQAGYHVLLEKPFTATAAEARELFALADAKGLVLMEAITIPYLPQYAFLQAELPKIGEVRGAMASFCARSARYDDYLKGIWNTTFDPACLGGALNDMNVYNLHLLCGLLGVPGRAEYRPSCGPNGIDTAGLGLVENMSYALCPDCGKHINVFGDSHVDEIGAKYKVPVLAKMPIDPELAKEADAGMIEMYAGDYLDGAAQAVAKLLK